MMLPSENRVRVRLAHVQDFCRQPPYVVERCKLKAKRVYDLSFVFPRHLTDAAGDGL